MIVMPEAGSLRLITQNDHACFAGELLALWHADDLPRHPRRQELIFAAREHDNGWRETDSAPRVDAASGRPHDFLTMPRAERFDIWCRGTARYAEERPYAALLITRHALALHRSRRGDAGTEEFFAEIDDLHDELTERVVGEDVSEEEIDADHAFLDLVDTASLALAAGWRECFEASRWQGEVDGLTLHLAPFPLAGSTSFVLRCRRIPNRRYESDTDLAVELARARWEDLEVRVARTAGSATRP